MNRDAIERLAIDMAAEELNEDTQALLKEYLADNHQADQWAQQMVDVFKKTDDTINTKIAETKVMTVPTPGRSKIRWQPVARWAAVIIITAGIGFLLGRRFHTPSAGKVTATSYVVTAAPVRTLADFKKRYEGTFWGEKIISSFERRQRPPRHATTQRLLTDLDEYLKENKL